MFRNRYVLVQVGALASTEPDFVAGFCRIMWLLMVQQSPKSVLKCEENDFKHLITLNLVPRE